jgi:hypothetical protein
MGTQTLISNKPESIGQFTALLPMYECALCMEISIARLLAKATSDQYRLRENMPEYVLNFDFPLELVSVVGDNSETSQ